MTLWHPKHILHMLTGGDRKEASARALRWTRAFRADPKLREDLIEMGGILAQFPQRFENGVEMPDPMNGERLAYERGRQDAVIAILAMGGLDNYELSQLMETPHGHP